MVAYGLITQCVTVFGHALEGAPIGLGNIFGSNQHTFQKAIDIAFFGQGYSNGFELIESAEQVIGWSIAIFLSSQIVVFVRTY